mmetsp:Transcript_23933/g.49734  ORF Transcript_23933/g.49734 Transcript_23933/m.49734 type:complete len:92 (+) Transcript_23933:127-402(+)
MRVVGASMPNAKRGARTSFLGAAINEARVGGGVMGRPGARAWKKKDREIENPVMGPHNERRERSYRREESHKSKFSKTTTLVFPRERIESF